MTLVNDMGLIGAALCCGGAGAGAGTGSVFGNGIDLRNGPVSSYSFAYVSPMRSSISVGFERPLLIFLSSMTSRRMSHVTDLLLVSWHHISRRADVCANSS